MNVTVVGDCCEVKITATVFAKGQVLLTAGVSCRYYVGLRAAEAVATRAE